MITANGQRNTKIDSLKQELSRSIHDTMKASILIDIYHYYSHYNTDSARQYVIRLQNLANTTQNRKLLTMCNYYLALNFLAKGDYRNNIAYLFIALNHAEHLKDSSYKAMIFNGIANCYATQKKPYQALIYYDKVIRLSQENNASLAIVYMNIGNIYYELEYESGIFKKSLEYYFRSLHLAKQLNDIDQIATIYSNLALVYCDEKKFDSARKVLNDALRMIDSMKIDENRIAIFYTLARVDQQQGFNKEALINYTKSLSISIRVGNKTYESDNYLGLSDTYHAMGDYKNAYKYHVLYKSNEDSVINYETAKQLNALESKFLIEKKQKENQLLLAKNELSKAEIKRQQMFSYIILIGLIFVSALSFFIFNGLKRQRKANLIISSQKIEVEKQKQKIEEHQKEIVDSINYAKKIQEAMLPSDKMISKHIKSR